MGGWTITQGEDGFLLSHTSGHISEPWGVIMAQDKALKLIEFLEWAEAIEAGGMVVAPPPPKPILKRGGTRPKK